MKSSGIYRNAAWGLLSNQWTPAVVFTLVYFAILAIVSLFEASLCIGSVLSLLLVTPMMYSYNIAFLEKFRFCKEFDIKSLFYGYNDYIRIVGTYLLMSLYILLWTLLLVVPGIIKSIQYSQTFFVLHDNPTLSYNAAIERSMDMMKGHKWEYFRLILTFIGWHLLGIITLGVAYLWVNPYIATTLVLFYEDLKKEYENK